MQKATAAMPGSNYELSQPIQLRFNELISGVRSDVAVKVFGDDMVVLNSTAAKIAASMQKVEGASEVKVEQTTGLPVLTINIDRDKAARYGLNVDRKSVVEGKRVSVRVGHGGGGIIKKKKKTRI